MSLHQLHELRTLHGQARDTVFMTITSTLLKNTVCLSFSCKPCNGACPCKSCNRRNDVMKKEDK